MKAWNEGGRELFVIGDPDQSIYGFRGSDAACFAKLSEDYPDLEIIELRENYRSSAPILNAALAVISENPGKERKLNAAKSEEEPAPVRIVKAGSDKGAAIFAAKEINRLTGGIGMLGGPRDGGPCYRKKGLGIRRYRGPISDPSPGRTFGDLPRAGGDSLCRGREGIVFGSRQCTGDPLFLPVFDE